MYNKIFARLKDERGFVFAEFLIALPLLILLFYSLGTMMLKIFVSEKNQIADYVLENEAHEVLERMTADARAATSVEAKGNQEIVFYFHAIGNGTGNKSNPNIIDIIDTRRYVRHTKTSEPDSDIYYLYAQRREGYTNSPIIGKSFFGDTSVERMVFSKRGNKLLHISLTLKNYTENTKPRELTVNTAVFMPACEKITGVPDE